MLFTTFYQLTSYMHINRVHLHTAQFSIWIKTYSLGLTWISKWIKLNSIEKSLYSRNVGVAEAESSGLNTDHNFEQTNMST